MNDVIDEKQYREAVIFMLRAHGDQKRKGSGHPYGIHPLRVAAMVRARNDSNTVMVVAAVLHDVVEDTKIELHEIAGFFGRAVAELVDELTNKFTKGLAPRFNRAQRKAQEIARLKTTSDAARIIKLCDRLDNLTDAPGEGKEADFNEVYAKESLVLAHELGDVDRFLKKQVLDAARDLQETGHAPARPLAHYCGDGDRQFLTPCLLNITDLKLNLTSAIESTTCGDCLEAYFAYLVGPRDDAPEWCESNKKPVVWLDRDRNIVGTGPTPPAGYVPQEPITTIANAKTREELIALARLIGFPESEIPAFNPADQWARAKAIAATAEAVSKKTGRPVIVATQAVELSALSFDEVLTRKNKAIIVSFDYRARAELDAYRVWSHDAGVLEIELARRYVEEGRPDEAVINLSSAGSCFAAAGDREPAQNAFARCIALERTLPKPRERLIAEIERELRKLEERRDASLES